MVQQIQKLVKFFTDTKSSYDIEDFFMVIWAFKEIFSKIQINFYINLNSFLFMLTLQS